MVSFLTARTPAWLVGAVVAVSLCAVGAPARAQPGGNTVEQVEQLAAAARAAYGSGQFEAAIGYYLRAYRLDPAGALLYNIAYVYDKKLNETGLAIAYYRRYVQATDAEPDVVERAIERIGQLKRRPDIGPVNRPTRPNPPDPVRQSGGGMSGQGIGGIVMTGLGVLSLAGGATFAALASGDDTAITEATSLVTAGKHREAGQDRALIADVMFGVGGAAVVTGIILLATDTGPVRVGTAPISGGALFTLGGSL